MAQVLALKPDFDHPEIQAQSAVYTLTDSIDQLTQMLIKHPQYVLPHAKTLHNEIIELTAMLMAMESGKLEAIWA